VLIWYANTIFVGRKKGCRCSENGNCLNEQLLFKNLERCPSCTKGSECQVAFDSCIPGVMNICSLCGLYALKQSRDSCKYLENDDGVERFAEEWMGERIVDIQSNYSHIRVRERDNKRSLIFVNSRTEEEMLESLVDMRRLYEPGFSYVRTFLGSTLLLHPEQNRVLILGLGGGGLVHFYQKFLPEVHLDIVEIDPIVKQISHEYFSVNETSTTRIYMEDAFDYINRCEDLYDLIYLDTFLEKSIQYESSGTMRMKTLDTLHKLKTRLISGKSLIAFNIMTDSAHTKEDLRAIESVFGNLKIVPTPENGNTVGIALNNIHRPSNKDLLQRAHQFDVRMSLDSFSFIEVAQQFIKHNKENQ